MTIYIVYHCMHYEYTTVVYVGIDAKKALLILKDPDHNESGMDRYSKLEVWIDGVLDDSRTMECYPDNTNPELILNDK